MAGDWLKIEKDTPEKPEMYRLAELLGISLGDAFLACFRVWRWADAQTDTGVVSMASPLAIDDQAKVSGFHDALAKVGWLSLRNGSVELPNFGRHMGMSGKRRSLDSLRKRSAKIPHDERNNCGPEKRREEKRKDGPRAPFKKPTVEEVAAYCQERRNAVDPQKFIDYYESNGWRIGGKGPMKNWQAAVRTWETNGFGSTAKPKADPVGHAAPTLTAEQLMERRRREDAELANQPRKTVQELREELERDSRKPPF